MIVLDLKLVLIVLLVLLGVVLYFGVTAVSRRRQQKQSPLTLLSHNPTDLRQQLDAAPYGLLLFNGRQQISYQNPAAHALLSAEVKTELEKDMQTGNGRTRTLNLPDDKAVSWWLCPLQAGTLVIMEDLSQQRRLEKSAHTFLGSLSHELRTPLTAVLAHIEVLRSPDLPQTVHDNSLNQIQQETTRISRLVQNLLTLSRLEASTDLTVRPLNVTILVESVISDLILGAEEKEMGLSLQADNDLPRVLVDEDRLKQVFLNLLDNALKYGRAGDKIDVQLTSGANEVDVSIQDSGPGIPAKDLPHVTEQLYRVRTDVEGSGLGLAIVAEILRQHGSQLTITSQTEGAETGTAVTFNLPIA